MTDWGGGASLLPYTPAGMMGSNEKNDGKLHLDLNLHLSVLFSASQGVREIEQICLCKCELMKHLLSGRSRFVCTKHWLSECGADLFV